MTRPAHNKGSSDWTATYRSGHSIVRAGVWIASIAVAVLLTAQLHLVTRKDRVGFPEGTDTHYLPPEQALHLFSLGYKEALADLIWVKTVLYFGEKMASNRDYGYLTNYLDAVISLNPYFRRVYLWAGAVTMYNLKQITNESVWLSIKYLEKGREVFPRDWEILFALASNYLRELQSDDPDQTARWRQKGADYMWQAANVGGGPAYLHSLAAKVWSESGRWQVAYQRLQGIYQSTDNPEVRESVENRMAQLLLTGTGQSMNVERLAARIAFSGGALGGLTPLAAYPEIGFHLRLQESSKSEIERFTREQRALEKEWKEELPYAPFDLFVILRAD